MSNMEDMQEYLARMNKQLAEIKAQHQQVSFNEKVSTPWSRLLQAMVA